MNQRNGKVFDRRFLILIGLQIVLTLALGVLILNRTGNGLKGSDADLENFKEVGSRLQAAGLYMEAARAYETFWNGQGDSPAIERAKLAFTIGDLYEKEGIYERALSWFYQAQVLDPDKKVPVNVAERVVALLERMKKFSAAKFALQDSTGLGGSNKKQGGVVVAKVGNREIYLHEVHEALDELPPMFRDKIQTPEQKREFAKKYVADLLLLEKARKLNLDEDPDVRKQLAKIQDQLMVQKVLESEVMNKVKVEDSDVRNYYEAHRHQYRQSGRAEISLIKVKSRDKATEVIKQLKQGKAFEELVKKYSEDVPSRAKKGVWPTPIDEETPFLPSAGDPLKANKMILATDEGGQTEPLFLQGHYYIFWVRKKSAPQELPMEQIKEQVVQDYRRVKETELYQGLLEGTLKQEDLTFYLDRIQ